MSGIWHFYDERACYIISRRRDLADPGHQEAIKSAARNGRRFRCGCRSDVPLWLLPVTFSTGFATLRRRRVSDPHLHGCPAETIERTFGHPLEVVYTDRMLFPEVPSGSSHLYSDTAGAGTSGARYEDLTHFFQAQFMSATLEAFAAANAGRSFCDSPLSQPSQYLVFEKLAGRFHLPALNRNTCSLVSALGVHRLQLKWGLSSQPLVRESDAPLAADEVMEFRIGPHWSCSGPNKAGETLVFSPVVLASSRGKAKARSHVIGPPYLYSALVRPEQGYNVVHYFYRVPVSTAGGSIHVVESEAERRSLAVLALEEGVALLKPHVQCDLSILGPLWPYPLEDGGLLPNRPDIIRFADGEVQVIYITDSCDEIYLSSVQRSVEEMRLFIGSAANVRAISAEDFANGNWRNSPT